MSDEDRSTEEVADATETEAPDAVEHVEEPAAPAAVASAASVSDTEPLEPPRKHTGLIVVVASLILLLVAFVFVALSLYPGLTHPSTSTTVAPAKAKITTTIGFVEALLNGNTLTIKSYLRTSVQSAISDSQWKDLAAQDASAVVSFAPAVWSGDAKASVKLSAQDTTGTLTFTVDPAKPLNVSMAADISGTTEVDTVVLAQEGTAWRVVSISNGTNTTTFDTALVKSMVATDTAQEPTPTAP